MRLSVVRLITAKEIRDLVRDRRTVMLVFLMPPMMYILFGIVGVTFAQAAKGQQAAIGVIGLDELSLPGGFAPLLSEDRKSLRKHTDETDEEKESDPGEPSGPMPLEVRAVSGDPKELLAARGVDAVLVVPSGFAADLAANKRPTVTVHIREGEEKSKTAGKRLVSAIRAWAVKLRERRFELKGLPKDFDVSLKIDQPQEKKKSIEKAATELRDQFAKVFPLMLVMWMVAGAIQPAVDLTAGEKERGTMETLLISPVERSEIVAGKFLAVTVFGYLSVLWNVVCLTTGAVILQEFVFGLPLLNFVGAAVCVIFGLPIAMMFSAVALALGVFARSTKEGQYYLIPMMLVTMPLAFYSMMPGIELTPGTALIPVTGAMLFQQKVLAVTAEPVPWGMLPVVLGALFVYVAVALSLAAWQFRRESVLFRETGPAKSAGGFLSKLFKRKAGV
jgi:sodium transport system permease protein